MTDQVNEAWERVASVRNHVHSMSKSLPDEWQDFANEIVNELSAAYQAGINTHPARGVVDEGTPSSRWAANGEADPYGTAYDCERAALAMGDLTDDELANAVFMHGDQRPSVEDLVSGKALLPGVYLTAAKDRIRWLSRKLQAAQPAVPYVPTHQMILAANAKVPNRGQGPVLYYSEVQEIVAAALAATPKDQPAQGVDGA